MPVMRNGLGFMLLGLLLVPPLGCSKSPSLIPTTGGTPTVTVSTPIERPVTNYVDYTGRIDAPFMTDIRPRVTGYLFGMPFKEGALVKKDDLLFQIDDRPYKAALDEATGFVEFCKAAVVKTQADYDIGLAVKKESKGAISDQEITKRLGARDEAIGNLARAKGDFDKAKLNFEWCKVLAPMDGQVNRFNYTLNNLVSADQTVLTTLVSTDPMYVYFDADENTVLTVLRKLVLPAKVDISVEKDEVPVLMGLADEEGFPHKGYINFVSNALNPSTGTLQLRGVFDNPANQFNKRLLRPGMFVRVRLPLGKPRPALLVNERAIVTDQANKCLLIVDKQNIVELRRVTLGPLQEDGLRVIEAGLKPGELVVVNGLQMARPRTEVKPEEKPMPVLPKKEPVKQP